jgi:RNA polymerase sigma-70 factor (ECF subfamily)
VAATANPEKSSDDNLDAAVLAAQRGDEPAFGLLYQELQPSLLRYLYALVGADCEDVAAETWLRIARDLGSFRGGWNQFRAWAVTIARYRATDHLRHHSRRPSLPTPHDEMTGVPTDDDTAAHAIDAISTQRAVALVAALPQDQAEAVLLRVVVGLDAKTAGRILGKRAGAVRMATFRGLRQLADRLAADAGRFGLERPADPRWSEHRLPTDPRRPVGQPRELPEVTPTPRQTVKEAR